MPKIGTNVIIREGKHSLMVNSTGIIVSGPNVRGLYEVAGPSALQSYRLLINPLLPTEFDVIEYDLTTT